jgi:hypothetical protein
MIEYKIGPAFCEKVGQERSTATPQLNRMRHLHHKGREDHEGEK